MTTNKDIVFEKLVETLQVLRAQGLITDRQYLVIKEDLPSQLDALIDEETATEEQVNWNLVTSI